MPGIFDTIGGLSGGLGGSGGVGSSIPSNVSSAHSAADATINPTVTLGSGAGSAGNFGQGGFSVMFPGAFQQPPDAINSPPFTTSIGIGTSALPVIGIALIAIMALFFLRR